jgi:hypothetical protein
MEILLHKNLLKKTAGLAAALVVSFSGTVCLAIFDQ